MRTAPQAPKRTPSRAALAALVCGLSAGCTLRPPLPENGTVSPSDFAYRESPSRSPLKRGNWWNAINDSYLHRQIESGLEANFEQRQLGERITQAAALLRQEKAALFPQVDLTSGGSADLDSDGDNRGQASFGGLLSYEVDVFGRLRSGVRAQESESLAAIQDWLTGRLLLSAAIAETRFLVLEQRARLAILKRQTKTNETTLRLLLLRAGQGLSTRVDLLQQERQLDNTRALIPEAEAEEAAAGYALDALLGEVPGSRSRDNRITLPAPGPLPATGLPSDLLANRPDLLAEWNRIRALDAEVAQALAERLPRFVITASADAGFLTSTRSLISALVAEATAPLTDGGTRRAEILLRKSLLEDALLGYSQSFIDAVRDVESALARSIKQAEQIRLTEFQLTTARETLDETRVRYSQGLSDYLPVIDALVVAQALELEVLSLRREELTLRVTLYRALGGPLKPVAPPTPRTL